MVEMIVVVVIVLVLVSLAFVGMRGSRRSTAELKVKAAARTYYDAAIEFAIDNGGTMPQQGTQDWPSAKPELGPVDKLQKDADERYVRHVPEAVTDAGGIVAFGSGAPTSTGVGITYRRTSLTTFEVSGWVDGELVCRSTNTAASTGTVEDC
ncbi:MAG: hypothetical protein KDC46_07480 [Thermoleophilia bacterium]|nr:hypothetical protein [Thermoleophilia bacterium]